MIMRHNTVMVAGFENPLMASSGVTRPSKVIETMMKKAILSTGKSSVTKRTMVISNMLKTNINSKDIYDG